MLFEEKIKAIETNTTRHPEWFYHAFFPNEKIYSSIFTTGIKCQKLISNEKYSFSYTGHNGNHYISLSKMETVEKSYSSFLNYQDKPAFIIDGIKTKKCSFAPEVDLLASTRWPFRYSSFLDEYQAYRIINPDKFIGLRCSILLWYRGGYKYYLEKLKEIIMFMKEHNIDLPIYDYTRASNHNIHLIDSDDYIELYEEIEKSFQEEIKKLKSENR